MAEENVFGEEEKEQKVVWGENIGDNPNAKVEYNRLKMPFLDPAKKGKNFKQDLFGNIPVEVTVELGKAQLTLQEVLELNEGAIVELKRYAEEPLDLVVNGQQIAQGEVVAVDDRYALKITKIIQVPKE
ncbi:MAG: flagellar motor switch protein FliN [Candidatus Margulisbacteria bacterium]|nr:flagellar motor switch protein FliN [Candidatus Margulisiibacteriota bacterium]